MQNVEISHDQNYSNRRKLGIQKTIEIVMENPGYTSAELADLTGEHKTMLARRLPEAARRKTPKIFKGAPRACTKTGSAAFTWWPKPVPTKAA